MADGTCCRLLYAIRGKDKLQFGLKHLRLFLSFSRIAYDFVGVSQSKRAEAYDRKVYYWHMKCCILRVVKLLEDLREEEEE